MKRIVYSCLLAALLQSCGNSEDQTGKTADSSATNTTSPTTESKLSKLSWVLGTWQNQTPDGLFTEHWEQTNEHLYTGHGVMVSPKGDTLFSEYIKLEEANDTLYYKPVISGQNEGKETVFAEKTLSETEVVFENPTHDFPQRIIYRKSSDSTLFARIEGKANGKDMAEEYNYGKATVHLKAKQ